MTIKTCLKPITACALGAALFLTGCEPADDRGEVPENQTQRYGDATVTPGDRVNDPAGAQVNLALNQQVQSALQADATLAQSAQNIEITTDAEGKVTLRGVVRSRDESNLIEERVKAIPGVESVDNELQVVE